MAKYRVGNSLHKIEIEDGWIVLDVGSGHNPHRRANILVDSELGVSDHRSGKPIKLTKERPFILADAQFLPFKDKVFDCVIASHVAEHVEYPDRFCKELMRISKRGYIETPSKLAEILLGEPFHKWYVSRKRSALIFERKKKVRPASELFYRLFYYNVDRAGHKKITMEHIKIAHIILQIIAYALRRLWALSRKINYTCFEWEQSFNLQLKL